MDESKDNRPLIAAPRHLKKRLFHSEVPDTLLVRVADPFPLEAATTRGAKRQSKTPSSRVRAFGRKRAVALLVVIIVSVTIPALLWALILAG